MQPGISERTFEFCYNAEFCQRHGALLASHPHLPSQSAEKDLGYDVEFQIERRGFRRSIFLQHKVAHFAQHRVGRNAPFYDAHGGPYYRFWVDNDQHNTLIELAQTRGNAFYCAPRFHTRTELEQHFRANTIARHSTLLNPLEVGPIQDQDRHNITFAPAGHPRILHSEPRFFSEDPSGGGESLPELREVEVTREYAAELADSLDRLSHAPSLRRKLPPDIETYRPVRRAQVILARVYDVSWLLL